MNATMDISIASLAVAFLLLIIPIYLSIAYKIRLIRPLLEAVIRMTIQLGLIGIFLKYLFLWNNAVLNVSWLAIMILVAVFSAVRGSSLKPAKVLIPAFISFSTVTFIIVFYMNVLVIKVTNIFDARYMVILGGMLLGNSLRGNIIGISRFYKSIRKDSKRFMYTLSLGATQGEATLPYFRDSIRLALQPTIAAMATMGIVALPGMMTGVILGGASPETAIKYQIMIMIAIVVSTIASIVLTILMTMRVCFTRYGMLRKDIFVAEKQSQIIHLN